MKSNAKPLFMSYHNFVPARLLWLATFAAALLLTLLSVKVMQGRAEVKAGQLPKPAVARQMFSTTNGEKFSLESKRGKVVVLQFFGTWCGYSKRQVSSINKLRDSEQSPDLQVIGMSVKDPRSNTEAVKQFIGHQKVNYPVVSEVEDKHFVQFVDSTNVSVPQTLIYGRDGRLIAHYLGYNQQVGAEIEQKVKAELEKK